VSWDALIPAASALLGVLLGSTTSLLLYQKQARLAERERAERRALALREERKATILHYFQVARDIERFTRQRHDGEAIDEKALIEEMDRLWVRTRRSHCCAPSRSVRPSTYSRLGLKPVRGSRLQAV